jgi:hypothetical protein
LFRIVRKHTKKKKKPNATMQPHHTPRLIHNESNTNMPMSQVGARLYTAHANMAEPEPDHHIANVKKHSEHAQQTAANNKQGQWACSFPRARACACCCLLPAADWLLCFPEQPVYNAVPMYGVLLLL